MKNVVALTLIFASLQVFAQPNCSSQAKDLAFSEYANSYGDPAGSSVKAIRAANGSVYYEVTMGKNNPEDGAVIYTVIFDDPSSCASDTARVFEKKR